MKLNIQAVTVIATKMASGAVHYSSRTLMAESGSALPFPPAEFTSFNTTVRRTTAANVDSSLCAGLGSERLPLDWLLPKSDARIPTSTARTRT